MKKRGTDGLMKKKDSSGRLFISRLFYLLGLSIILWIPFHGVWQHLQQVSVMNQWNNQLQTWLQEEQEQEEEESNEGVDGVHSLQELETILQEQNQQQGNIDPFSTKKSLEGYPDAVGMLDIPKIGEQLPLYIGASDENLARGAAQITGTSLPFGGMNSHSVIAGHRGWYGSNFFINIDHLAPGDLIYLSYLDQEGFYVTTDSELIEPWQTTKLTEKTPDKEELTLLTCHPLFSTQQRLLVHSRRLTEAEVSKLELDSDAGFKQEKLPVSVSESVQIKPQEQQNTQENKPESHQEVIQDENTHTFWTTALYKAHPYQYSFYWIILGAGSMSWFYTVFQLMKQIVLRIMKIIGK